MSNTNSNKTYVDGLWAKERRFDDGGSLLNVSILVPKFAEFVKKYKKDSGYLNIVIAAKRNPDDNSTHYAYLDTWEPTNRAQSQPKANKGQSKKASKPTPTPSGQDENDDAAF